ncbi:DUF370 domain-containing protein [Metallumcola ferriviriculae]|uniref:DUF370 domain-containing protein n=1 Tax=Metallumcola ferriviriculae TaxID=3039180 RepID=A0AAU0UK08_9FIRM|nr:DUF370 domain-containing protein [Desulfitibacteraceae bacterium MK1]
MYLHIGGDVLINKKEIVAIIDYDNVDKSLITDEFVELASVEGLLEKLENEMEPKSFIITEKKVYLSSISSLTLQKRSTVKNQPV